MVVVRLDLKMILIFLQMKLDNNSSINLTHCVWVTSFIGLLLS